VGRPYRSSGWPSSMPIGDPLRLVRYGISGGLSAVTHFGVGFVGVRAFGVAAVVASAAGFAASVVVSYLLQRGWVFRSGRRHGVAGPRFLVVTGAAFALNTVVLWVGVVLLGGPFVVVQGVAIVLIPVLNYAMNSRWTFAGV
jgi:putative flippase GtrA